MKLGKCRLLDVGGRPVETFAGPESGENPDARRVLRRVKNMVRRIADTKGTLRAKTLAPLFNPAAQASVLLGFLTFDRVDTEVQATGRKRRAESSFADTAISGDTPWPRADRCGAKS